jgi:hypothetical protein
MRPAIQLDGQSGQWKELWEVQSDSRPGTAYVVGKTEKGSYGCSCPAWIYHTPRQDCKHIAHVKRQVAAFVKAPASARPILTAEKIAKIMTRFSLLEVE